MSSAVPPQIIQVKRKRNDDGPVTFLRIEQSIKRHRSGAFLYQRHDPEAAVDSPAAAAAREHATAPAIRTTRPGEEKLPLETLKRNHATASAGHGSSAAPRDRSPAPSATASGRQQPTIPQAPQPAAKVMTEQRRFHLSRSNNPSTVERHSPLRPGTRAGKPPHPAAAAAVTTKGSAPALFVERSKRKQTSLRRKAAEGAARAASRSPRPASAQSHHESESRNDERQPAHSRADRDMRLGDQASGALLAPKPRLPLQRRRGGGSAASSTPRLPDSLVNRWDTDMEKLAREMNDYTLQHIARDLESIKERDAMAAPKRGATAASGVSAGAKEQKSSPGSPLKFKPHPPAKRYSERHPESAKAVGTPSGASSEHNGSDESMDVDMDMDKEATSDSDEDDGDYVIDTYVRVNADSVRAQATPDKVGLLVLDNEPDLESFYGQESDSEDEFEDEDDENAENYYTADYPDDEVASDDEYGRNPYAYRTGNASDLEEYDDASESEEEGDGQFKITIGKPQNLPGLY